MPNNFTSSHILQLWFSRVKDTTKELEQLAESLLSPTEGKRLRSTLSINKKREFLTSRLLMRHALSQHFHTPEKGWHFTERINSAPIINNLPRNIYFSLSHSNGVICFALSNSPIGIDIEATNKQRDYLALAKLFMSNEESDFLIHDKGNQAENFYRIWCAKEAYYKAIPSSAQSAISFKKISIFNLIKNSDCWFLFEGKTDQFRMSVVINNNPESISYNKFPLSDHIKIIELNRTSENIRI